jgi:stress response protein SCP2
MSKLEKGEHGPLNVTQKARHRVLAGLGWDPADEADFKEKIDQALGGKKIYHDLDLACFFYDSHNVLIGSVSPDPAQTADDSGKIYHSGDNAQGHGEGDDEQISVELKNLDPDIHHVLFTAKIQTGHSFAEVDTPEMRLADGMTNADFLKVAIDHPEGKGCDVFVFAHIYRRGAEWRLHHVAEYLKSADLKAWRDELPRFLQVK